MIRRGRGGRKRGVRANPGQCEDDPQINKKSRSTENTPAVQNVKSNGNVPECSVVVVKTEVLETDAPSTPAPALPRLRKEIYDVPSPPAIPPYTGDHDEDGMFSESSTSSSSDNFHSDKEQDTDKEMLANSDRTKILEFLSTFEKHSKFSVNSNASEILFMVISLSISQNLSQRTTVGIFKMLNFILGTTIFPETVKAFKNIFNPGLTMTVHIMCNTCGSDLGIQTTKSYDKDCKTCKESNKFSGYCYWYSFQTLDVESQLKDLIARKIIDLDKLGRNEEGQNIVGIHNGKLYKEATVEKHAIPEESNPIVLPGDPSPIILTYSISSDSAKVKNTNISFIPMHLMINEVDISVRGKNLILAGFWYGKREPHMEVLYHPLIDKVTPLAEKGIQLTIGGKTVKVHLMAACSPVGNLARSKMQGINDENDYYCCSWCTIKGRKMNGTVRYPIPITGIDYTPRPRVEGAMVAAFMRCVKKDKSKNNFGVRIASQLWDLPRYNMIKGYIPEYMHGVCLGVTRMFIKLWICDSSALYYIGGPTNVSKMDQILQNIKLPKYVTRNALPQMKNAAFMTARECENFLLFYSPVLLDGILPERFYDHWLLLVGSMHLLLQDEINDRELTDAERMLKDFVELTEKLYSANECTYDMHQLLHLADSVRDWGPYWCNTAFPYDTANGTLKNVLQNFHKTPHQTLRRVELIRTRNIIMRSIDVSEKVDNFCRAISEDPSSQCFAFNRLSDSPTFIGIGKTVVNVQGFDDDERFFEYEKLKFRGVTYEKYCPYGTRKNENSYVELKHLQFARIDQILKKETDGKCYLVVTSHTWEPVQYLKTTKKICRECDDSQTIEFSEVKGLAVHVFAGVDREYIIAIPHKHFMMNR